jgi:hypothetical protein
MSRMRIVLLVIILSRLSLAASLSYDTPPTPNTGLNPCGNALGYLCTTAGYFNAETLGTQNPEGISALFVSAFNAWNSTVGDTWTLNAGGALSGSFDAVVASAYVDGLDQLGGVTIEVTIPGIVIPALSGSDQLVWAQGLNENYLLNGSIVAPFYQMDITSLSCSFSALYPTLSCPPAYPFQLSNSVFFDRPTALYEAPGTTQAFFNANAYLAVENPDTRTLTVYDGISYGFQNSVSSSSPEPGTWLPCVSLGVLFCLWRQRRVS